MRHLLKVFLPHRISTNFMTYLRPFSVIFLRKCHVVGSEFFSPAQVHAFEICDARDDLQSGAAFSLLARIAAPGRVLVNWETESGVCKVETHSSFKVFLTRGPCCRALMDHRNHHKDQKSNIHFAFAACGVFLYWPWMQFCSKISHFPDACRPQSGSTEPHQLNFLAQWVPTMSCT